jgi:hypothetical protein
VAIPTHQARADRSGVLVALMVVPWLAEELDLSSEPRFPVVANRVFPNRWVHVSFEKNIR